MDKKICHAFQIQMTKKHTNLTQEIALGRCYPMLRSYFSKQTNRRWSTLNRPATSKHSCTNTRVDIIRKKLINVWNHHRALCHNAIAHQRITKILLHETHQAKLLNEAMPGCHKAIDNLWSFALFHTRYERSGYHFPIAWSRKKMPLECRELIRSELEWCKEPTPNMKSHSNKILSPLPKYQSILPNNHLLT